MVDAARAPVERDRTEQAPAERGRTAEKARTPATRVRASAMIFILDSRARAMRMLVSCLFAPTINKGERRNVCTK